MIQLKEFFGDFFRILFGKGERTNNKRQSSINHIELPFLKLEGHMEQNTRT
jgi:hypothetical protein